MAKKTAGKRLKRAFGAIKPTPGSGAPILLQRRPDSAVVQVDPTDDNASLGPRARVLTPDPLDWYFHRRQITGHQHRAGNHIRVLHYAAHGSGVATVNYRNFGGGGGNAADNWKFSSRQAWALRELAQLLELLPSKERTMVERVIVFGEFANHVASRLDLRPRLGIAILRRALDHIDAARSTGRQRPVAQNGSRV